ADSSATDSGTYRQVVLVDTPDPAPSSATVSPVRRWTSKARHNGLHLLDGTLIATDRVHADRPYCSAKHRSHGRNVQVIVGPNGTILWTALPQAPLQPQQGRPPRQGHRRPTELRSEERRVGTEWRSRRDARR